ncbi:hypothetical protein FCV25MIE_04715 [Fagus crenata]
MSWSEPPSPAIGSIRQANLATGQIFLTYEDLMHYVNYAIEAKVSIYSPLFPFSRGGQPVNHLMFADDSLFFFHATTENARNLKGILDWYCWLSGQTFKAKKLKKNTGSLARRAHLLIKKSRRKHLSSQSSRSSAVKRSKVLSGWRKCLSGHSSKLAAVDQGKEIIDLEESTVPEDIIDLGESSKADSLPLQAELEVEQVANIESSDPVSAN